MYIKLFETQCLMDCDVHKRQYILLLILFFFSLALILDIFLFNSFLFKHNFTWSEFKPMQARLVFNLLLLF